MSAPWNNWFHCNGTLKGNWLRGDDRGWRARHHREHVEGDYKNPPPPNVHAAERQHSHILMKHEPNVLESFDHRVEVCRLLGGVLRFYGVEVQDLAVSGRHYHVLVRFEAAAEKHRAAAEKAAHDDPSLLVDGGKPHSEGLAVPATGVAGLSRVAGLCAAHHFKDGRDPLPRYILGKCHSWTSREFKKWLVAQGPGTPVPGTIPGGLFAPRPHCKPIADEAHFFNTKNYIRDHQDEGGAVWSILFGPERK